MNQASCNCIVCANEFDPQDLQSTVASKINSTNFKVCQGCLDNCDPAEDYAQVRQIVSSYLKGSEARALYNEAQDIIDSLKK